MKTDIGTKLLFAGLFITIGLLVSTIFYMAGISEIVFLPMHLPILLCGLICGSVLGGLAGLLVPFLCSVFTGTPLIYPIAVYMMSELAVCGIISGALSGKANIFIALIIAIFGGRLILGVTQIAMLGFNLEIFTIDVFLAETFVTALPGIIIQLTVIPLLLLILKKAKLPPFRT